MKMLWIIHAGDITDVKKKLRQNAMYCHVSNLRTTSTQLLVFVCFFITSDQISKFIIFYLFYFHYHSEINY